MTFSGIGCSGVFSTCGLLAICGCEDCHLVWQNLTETALSVKSRIVIPNGVRFEACRSDNVLHSPLVYSAFTVIACTLPFAE
jgi:hypothetical protein